MQIYLNFVKVSHYNDSPFPDVNTKHALVLVVFLQSKKYFHVAFAIEF